MGVEGGMRVIKYLLFIFNLLFLLSGLVLVIIGAVAAAKLAPYSQIANVSFSGVGVFLIVIGIVVVIISFFGCLGAYKENYCLLIMFIILMILSLLALVAAIITAFVMRNKVTNLIGEGLLSSIPTYIPGKKHDVSTELWDEIQPKFECCGSTNYKDWNANPFYKNNVSLPDSCCNNKANATCNINRTGQGLFAKGCANELSDLIFHNVVAVGGTAAAIAILQFIGILFGSCLAHGLRKEYQTV